MTTAPPTTLGDYLRRKRTEAGMSQTRLAELVDTAQHVVSAYEHNKRTPSGRTLALLAEHLPGATASELLALIAPTQGLSATGEGHGDGAADPTPTGQPPVT